MCQVIGPDGPPLLEVGGLCVDFDTGREGFWGTRRQTLRAVNDASFSLDRGETLGLVGESGSGKTTTGRAILRRVQPSAGTIRFEGEDVTGLTGRALRRFRRKMQVVFQDPFGSLNPRMRVREIIAEPLLVHGLVGSLADAREQVLELLERVGLPAESEDRYPHSFSGGQRQRIGIARALILEPALIVADEPVSALDVAIQAQIVNLMQDIQEETGVSYLFISHDLAVVRHICHRIAIMYAGHIVEIATREGIYLSPAHPYTQSLLSAVPIPEPSVQRRRERIPLQGELPDLTKPIVGCVFATRCPHARTGVCDAQRPLLRSLASGHMVACHFAEDLSGNSTVVRISPPAS